MIALMRAGRRRVLKSRPTPHQDDQIIDERLQAMNAAKRAAQIAYAQSGAADHDLFIFDIGLPPRRPSLIFAGALLDG
jgi:hypothetical protein